MDSNKLKEAIAEAKILKEAAIANAKEALAEEFTPKIQSMFSNAINEMEKAEDEKDEVKEGQEDKDELSEADIDQILAELASDDDETVSEGQDEEIDVDALVAEAEAEAANDINEAEEDEGGSEEVEVSDEIEGEEEIGDDEEEIDLDDFTVSDLRELIRSVVEEEMEEEGGELDMDMEMDDDIGGEEEFEAEEELTLEALLNELKSKAGVKESKSKDEVNEAKDEDELKESKDEEDINEAKEDEDLKEQVAELIAENSEINLLNSKMLYSLKIMKEHDLSGEKKVKLLAAFDKATDAKQAKMIYEALKLNMTKERPKKSLNENRNFASSAAGVATDKPVVEVDPVVERMQKLAGLTEDKIY